MVIILNYLLLFVLLSPSFSYAEIIFSEDYEVTLGDVDTGNTPYNDLVAKGWTVVPNCFGYCSMSIVAAPSGRSGKVLRYTYGETAVGVVNDDHNAELERTFTGVPEIYERWYLRFDTNNVAVASPFPAVFYKQHYINTSVLPNFVTDTLEGVLFTANQSASNPTCPDSSPGPTCNLEQNTASVTLNHGQWYCVETHYGQSQVEIWIDGIRVVNYTSNVVYPANYNEVKVYRQGGNNEYRYEDDYIVSTTRIGCEPVTSCH